MASHDPSGSAVEERANRLYWESDASVNEIAEQLDLSKGALYGLVRPQSAGLVCPECAGELEYPNRTARHKGFVTCPACGFEGNEAEADGEGDDTVEARSGPRVDGATLVATLFGTAAGMVLVRWIRGR